jgi:hypothetical protein
MMRFILIALAVFCLCSHAGAEELFQGCNKVLDNSNHKLLREYLSRHTNEHEMCQRLSNREFLYTDYRNVYYCTAENGILSCAEHNKGTWFPNISMAARFFGKNGKQFVLFRTSRLSKGGFGSGYQAFFLVPKDVNARGYLIFPFAGAGESNGLYSDAGGVCDNMGDDSEAITSTSKPFEILNEGQTSPIVRFNQEITSCKSGEVFRQTLEYTWQDGTFQKTLDKKEPIPKREEASRPEGKRLKRAKKNKL